MSNELVVREDHFERALKDITNTQSMCEKLLQSKHYQRMKPEDIYAIVTHARILNINPVEALNGALYSISGKIGMSTEMMARMIRSEGHSISKDPKSDSKMCILHGKRKDNGDIWTCTFSIENAKTAGLYKNVWISYPEVMMYNRAMSMLARQLFPDVIKGAGYTMDELKEIASSKTETINYVTGEIEEIKQVQEVKAPTITAEQAEGLENILKDCSDDHKKNVWSLMSRKPHCCKAVKNMPVMLYNSIYDACLQNREITISKRDAVLAEAVAREVFDDSQSPTEEAL